MESIAKSNWSRFLPQKGDIYFVNDKDTNVYHLFENRPVIILKVFEFSRRVLVAPISTAISLTPNPDNVLIRKEDKSFLQKDSYIRLDFMKTYNINQLQTHIGIISNVNLDQVYSKMDFTLVGEHRENATSNNNVNSIVAEELPQILVCGPHGDGRGIEILQALANKITRQGKYEGFALVDTPERPDLTLKRKFQLYALLSRGVIIYFSDECSGACNEFDWASELDVFTVGIYKNHLPTEMLSGISEVRGNVRLINEITGSPFPYIDEALEWIDLKIEERIRLLDEFDSPI